MDQALHASIESAPAVRKSWEEPRIVLERLLLVSAQDGGGKGESGIFGPSQGAPGAPSFLGPLNASGDGSGCL